MHLIKLTRTTPYESPDPDQYFSLPRLESKTWQSAGILFLTSFSIPQHTNRLPPYKDAPCFKATFKKLMRLCVSPVTLFPSFSTLSISLEINRYQFQVKSLLFYLANMTATYFIVTRVARVVRVGS